MDTLQRLHQLLDERGWTEYRLAKNCGLSNSTIANIYHRNTIPSISTLEAICTSFGISLSQRIGFYRIRSCGADTGIEGAF